MTRKPLSPATDLKEIAFDDDDLSLFQIDDLQLKADAIRNSVLPKLNVLMNHAVLRIKDIYDVEVFEDSHIAQSPNFRTRRENELKVDYQWAVCSLTGKRVKNKWLGLARSDGKPVQHHYRLSESRLSELRRAQLSAVRRRHADHDLWGEPPHRRSHRTALIFTRDVGHNRRDEQIPRLEDLDFGCDNECFMRLSSRYPKETREY